MLTAKQLSDTIWALETCQPKPNLLGMYADQWPWIYKEDGLESAKPDLQSTFKKPGGVPADPRLWEMLADGRAERRLKRREHGRRRDVTDYQRVAEG